MTTPWHHDDAATVFHGDCMTIMRDLPAESVDAVVTDPPYGLAFMGATWDTFAPSSPQPRRSRPKRGMPQAGLTYQRWCHAWARGCLRLLKPGGHLVAFGGTRTCHRLACGIEDAGFEIRDRIGVLTWVYGSGFPKSRNLHGQWEGWGTALKPAHEPILLARKPLAGTVVANVNAHGTGALHIDACRVPTTDLLTGGAYTAAPQDRWDGHTQWRYPRGQAGDYQQPEGRWPPNLLLVHHPNCHDPSPCFPSCPVAELDRQSGQRRAGGDLSGNEPSCPFQTVYGDMAGRRTWQSYRDTGGASRFYPTFRYHPKANRTERPRVDGRTHPTVKPVGLMRWLVRLVTPPGGRVLDPFAGSGTTLEACAFEQTDCIAIEQDQTYLPLIASRLSASQSPTPTSRGGGPA